MRPGDVRLNPDTEYADVWIRQSDGRWLLDLPVSTLPAPATPAVSADDDIEDAGWIPLVKNGDVVACVRAG